MNAAAYLLNLVIRVLGASALALGLSFWLGYARSLTQLHMLLGIGLLLSLWAVAWIAWLSAGRGALAAFGVVGHSHPGLRRRPGPDLPGSPSLDRPTRASGGRHDRDRSRDTARSRDIAAAGFGRLTC